LLTNTDTLITEDKQMRDEWLQQTNELGVMTRPAWKPMHQLEINNDSLCADMSNTMHLFNRLVNVPSSVTASIREIRFEKGNLDGR